jgi:UPF0271 protein
MPFISSANVACGFHAGDPETILETVRMALESGVAVGAHPGYPDPGNFGRQPMQLAPGALRAAIIYQVGALKAITEALGGKLAHVKPHGALYNAAARDLQLSLLIASAVREIDPGLILVGLSGSRMPEAVARFGLAFASEAFADRAYNDDGTLVARNLPGAVIHDPEAVLTRVLEMIFAGRVTSLNGKPVALQVETLCIHGDNEAAPQIAERLSRELPSRGVMVRAPGREGGI